MLSYYSFSRVYSLRAVVKNMRYMCQCYKRIAFESRKQLFSDGSQLSYNQLVSPSLADTHIFNHLNYKYMYTQVHFKESAAVLN